MAVHDRYDVRPRAVNRCMDEPFEITFPIACIKWRAVQIIFDNVFGGNEHRSNAAREQKTLGIVVVSDADMPKTVEYTLVIQNAIRVHQITHQLRANLALRRRRLRW